MPKFVALESENVGKSKAGAFSLDSFSQPLQKKLSDLPLVRRLSGAGGFSLPLNLLFLLPVPFRPKP